MHNVTILIKSVLIKIKITTTVRYFWENACIGWLKINHKNSFHSIILLRFGETKVTREKFYAAKKPLKNWDVNVDNIIISKLVKTKTSSKYFIGYIDEVIRPLVLIMPKVSGYVKTFKVKDGDKDKNNKLMSFRIDDEKLLEKYKAIRTKIEDFKNIELNALPVYDDRYIKTKITTYSNKVYIY